MSPRTGGAYRAASLFLVTLVLVVVVFPLAIALVEVVAGLAGTSPAAPAATWRTLFSPQVLVNTFAWPLGIGVVATALAWPAAWAIRRRGASLIPWMLVPLSMPAYLAYSGYGLIRAPGTLIGDWLERAAHGGWPAAPFIAGQVLAFIGMCLWAWPIPALVLGWSASKVDAAILDSLAIDRAGPLRRFTTLAAILKIPVISSIALVALVMLGSAVPLHLAQVPTWSIKLWFALDNSALSERWRIWMLSLPLVAAAAVAAWMVVRAAARPSVLGLDVDRGRFMRGRSWIVVFIASTLVPLACFAWSLRRAESLREFWRTSTSAAGWTSLVALHVAFLGMLIGASVWFLMSARPNSRVPRLCVVLLTTAGLIPGVILGSAVNQAWLKWEQTRPIADSYWVIVLAHAARFCWIPAWVGCLLAGAEQVDRRHQRLIDGAAGLKGWWIAAARPGAGILAAASIFAGLMSVHEIESTVLVQPPGIDGLARQILQFLHFSRMEELSAASVWMIGGGLAAAALTAWATRRSLANRATPDRALPTVNES
ncbi:MAG: hypothetical protein AMXMBFR58_13820 [Phycisphaerae bacterium]